MLNINFEGNNIDFYDLCTFAIDNNIDTYELLHSAFEKGALVAKERKLLSNFIESISTRSSLSKS